MNKLTDYDRYLFHEGTHHELYEKFGAHRYDTDNSDKISFTVWAPNAQRVQLICSFSGWIKNAYDMHGPEDGVWSLKLEAPFDSFSYRYIITGFDGVQRFKSDPFSFSFEMRPNNASVFYDIGRFQWNDSEWRKCSGKTIRETAVSIYEVHLGSWKCKQGTKQKETEFFNYREYAQQLAEYCLFSGYSHVELMGICEHPFDGSWGYQVNGYFAPTSRYGSPEDFMWMIDHLHRNGIGVILDWVPAHFVTDSHSLGEFDGTHLYEADAPSARSFPEWGTYAFDLEKPEVRSFLLSSAYFWLNTYHIDGLRIDAVQSMLFLDYGGRKCGPNIFGTNDNLAGFSFLRDLNNMIHENTAGFTAAEDSSIMKGITASTAENGLGFDFKWNMGWMHDTLDYMTVDPIFRNYHKTQMKDTLRYAFSEHFILVLSHDEVVHLKKSLIGKMPGRFEDKIGNLKAYYAWMFMHPGKKLLFMGQDFGQDREWSEQREIDWFHADDPGHRELLFTVKALNRIYRETPYLFKYDHCENAFCWNGFPDDPCDVLSFIRLDPAEPEKCLIIAVNFSPMQIFDLSLKLPYTGSYERIFSTYDTVKGEGGPEETGMIPLLFASDDNNKYGAPYTLYSLRPFEAVILKFNR